MKKRFAAMIGMVLMILAFLPVQAAASESASAFYGSGSVPAAEKAAGAYGADSFRYLGDGWHLQDGSWFYVRGGKAVTGWVKDSGKWYYLDRDGVMKTGWVKDSGKWYFLSGSGAMKTGWLKDGGKYYYLTGSGAMKTGWLKLSGKKYYFGTNGALDIRKTRSANASANSGAKDTAAAGGPQSGTAESRSTDTGKRGGVQNSGSQSGGTSTSKAAKKTKGEMVAEYALQFVGNPYVYGGCSLTEGTDCSGFVMLIYRHFGISLPHYDAAIRTMGKPVSSLKEAKAGDVVCYYGHVAIYLGDGRIVHASNSRDGIKISERADYRTIAGIRRFFD